MRRFLFLPLYLCAVYGASSADYSFEKAQTFLKTYCQACHQGKAATGGLDVHKLNTPATLGSDPQKWTSVVNRLKNGEMPPKGAPAPSLDLREQFTQWADASLRAEACAAGIVPGPSPIRRLNRDEYTATIRDLLDMQMDVAGALPADGAGGEGFDNAAETLFLSPLHSEKYMDVAKFAMDYAAKEYKSRTKILIAKPGPGVSADQAAREILKAFLPRAFRRPITDADVSKYMTLFQAAQKQKQPFEASIFFALRGALVSPKFLFRTEPPNTSAEARPLDQYSMASRLSYFLWGSMPDELLFDIAADGKLQDPEVLKELVPRMLRNDRSQSLAQRFVEQWLHTRELTTTKVPDAKLFANYVADEDIRSDVRLQPVYFFRELLTRNESLLNLIDSKYTIGTAKFAKFYGINLQISKNAQQQPQWYELPEGSRRGGVLGMPAVLIVSSHPYRTSPVLRGAWILDSLLGTPPPPPPPNVPALEDSKDGPAPKSVRELLTKHRENAVCASCHARIDPLGFALENFDAIGRWRDEDNGKPVDNSAELMDGTKFSGPDELKRVLLDRKDLFVRNLANKMLGYALGRGLTLKDSCTVDSIVAYVKANDYKAQSLIEAIVLSVPFRFQAPSSANSLRSAGPSQKEQQKP